MLRVEVRRGEAILHPREGNWTHVDAIVRDRPWALDPSGPIGASLVALLFALAIATAAALGQGALDDPSWLPLALFFAAPVAIAARGGHFGSGHWQVPTPGAFVLLFWLVGLAPSMIQLSVEARATVSLSEDAVFYGRIIAIVWFILFAIALGPAPARPLRPRVSAERDGIGFALMLAWWAICGSYAARFDALSAYRSSSFDLPRAGSADMSLVLYYTALTPMMIPVGFLMRSRGVRWLGNIAIVLGAAALFLYSSRRLWIVSIYLCVIVAQTYGKLRKGWMAVALLAVILGTGPVVFAYREARLGPSGGSAIDEAWDGITSYVTDPRAREDASAASSGNLRVRLGTAAILFGVTDHALMMGPNLSPSPLQAAILWAPTPIWPDKNVVSALLDAKQQFQDTGRFLHGDMPVSPIAEFIFQIGAFAPVGGLLYGFAARLLNRTHEASAERLSRFVAWTGSFIVLSFFDGGTVALAGLREPLFLAALLGALGALLERLPDFAARQVQPWRS
jgi:hypothetical protein